MVIKKRSTGRNKNGNKVPEKYAGTAENFSKVAFDALCVGSHVKLEN